MRDWTGLSDADCKTDEERKERREYLRERFIAGQEASARAEAERQTRLKQAKRDGKEVDGDGFAYNEQKKHDHRTFKVRSFVDAEPVTLVRWDEALGRLWDQVIRQIFAHQTKHGCLPETGELQKWLVIWKQSHPELAELPSEVMRKLVWEASGAFAEFLRAPEIEASDGGWTKDYSLLQRRRQHRFYLNYVKAKGHTFGGGVTFHLPRLGKVICEVPRRETPEDQTGDEGWSHQSFGDMLTGHADQEIRIKSCRLWRSPTTNHWYITLSFERLEPLRAPTKPVRELVLETVYTIFDLQNATALTAEELIPALAKQDIHRNPKSLKAELWWYQVLPQRDRRDGQRARYYQFADIAAAYQQLHPTPPAPVDYEIFTEGAPPLSEAELLTETARQRQQSRAILRGNRPVSAEGWAMHHTMQQNYITLIAKLQQLEITPEAGQELARLTQELQAWEADMEAEREWEATLRR